MADGTITFSTALDNGQLEKDLKQAERDVDALKRKVEKAESGKSAVEAEMERAEAAIHETEAAIDRLNDKLAAVPSTARSAEEYYAQRDEIERIGAEISEQNARLERQIEDIDALNEKWQKLDAEATGYSSQLDGARARQSELAEEYARAYAERTAGEARVEGAAREAGQAGAEGANQAAQAGAAGAGAISKRIDSLVSKFTKTMRRVFVFAAITKAVKSLKGYLTGALADSERFADAWENLKTTLAGFAQPAVNVLVPAVTSAVNALSTMLMTLARMVDSVFGTAIQSAIQQARAAAQAARATENQAKSAKKLAKAQKEANRQVMAFDEINAMSGDLSGGEDASQDAAAQAPDWGALDVGKVSEKLAEIMLIIGAALLAVGAVLAFSGINIPLGLTLMAIGALMLYTAYKEQWDKLPQEVRDAILAALVITGVALIVLGAVIAFSGANIPLGIGLMLAGAALLYAAASLSWKGLPGDVKSVLNAIMLAVSAALLVIGAILALSGANVPLGVGLIAAGAIGLAMTAALNWDQMSNEVKGVVLLIASVVSAALIVIGAALAFSGANVPLGVGLIAAGAIGLAASAAIAWSQLPQDVRATVATILKVLAAALLVVGAVLALSGANAPLGIGLMIAGAASLASAMALSWDSMPNGIRDVVSQVLGIIGGALIVIGVILCATGAGIPLGVGCILAGVASLAGAAAINWDFLKDKVKGIWSGIVSFWNQHIARIFTAEWWRNIFKSIVNGLIDALNSGLNAVGSFVNWVSSGVGGILKNFGVDDWSFTLSMPQIPHLAQGAVIPPNREFLAVLGDQRRGANIEAPENLMRQIVREEAGMDAAAMQQAFAAALAQVLPLVQGGGSDGDVTMILQVGNEELARAVSKGKASLARRGLLNPEIEM